MQDVDSDLDFAAVSERRAARWRQAADVTGVPVEDWVADTLDRAATDLERATRLSRDRTPYS